MSSGSRRQSFKDAPHSLAPCEGRRIVDARGSAGGSDGGEGLKLACKHSVDLLIVDHFMPEMNGQEVAIEMRRLKPQATIIMLSGAVDVPEQALNWVDAFVARIVWQRQGGRP